MENTITKHYSIREAKNEIKMKENDLDRYLTQKKISYLKTQPQAIDYSKILVDSSHVNFDSFLNYQIKNENYDSEIFSLISSILMWQKYVADELYRMSQHDEIGLIIYLKEDEKKRWIEIDKLLHHAEGYSRLKYNRYNSKK